MRGRVLGYGGYVERGREEWVDVGVGRLWTVTAGRGVPLVLCHGGPGAYDYLGPVAGMLEDMAEVHRFDQRGGGRSTPSGPWTLQALIDDLELLRRHWSHERWVVVGHSWGAHLALLYALAHPEHALGVVFLNGTGLRWGWGAERRATRMTRLTGSEQAEVARLEAVADTDEMAQARLRDLWWLTDFADRRNAERTRRFADYPTARSVAAALERDWEGALDEIDDRANRLSLPVLVLHGEADPVGERGPREVARILPKARFVSLRAVGHVPWLEDASELRHHVRTFVTECAQLGR